MRLRYLPCLCRSRMARHDRDTRSGVDGRKHAELCCGGAAQLTSLLPDYDARRARWAHRANAGWPALADWSTNNRQNWELLRWIPTIHAKTLTRSRLTNSTSATR